MFFNLFKKSTKIWWKIWFFWLSEWWNDSFSDQEKSRILEIFQPLWWDWKDTLIWSKIEYTSSNELSFLSTLSNWFIKPELRGIWYKFISKAEEYINKDNISILDKHFFYLDKIKLYYRNRDIDDFALEKAISACENQIEMSSYSKKAFLDEYKGEKLPSHTWFEQLAIIQEKKWEYQKAIDLSKQALAEWWWWDWQKRIDRNNKKNKV